MRAEKFKLLAGEIRRQEGPILRKIEEQVKSGELTNPDIIKRKRERAFSEALELVRKASRGTNK